MEWCHDIVTNRNERRFVMWNDAVILWQTEINGDLEDTDNASITWVIWDNQYNHDTSDYPDTSNFQCDSDYQYDSDYQQDPDFQCDSDYQYDPDYQMWFGLPIWPDFQMWFGLPIWPRFPNVIRITNMTQISKCDSDYWNTPNFQDTSVTNVLNKTDVTFQR